MKSEKEFDHILKCRLRLVEDDMQHLNVTRIALAHVLIRRIVELAYNRIHVSNRRCDYAIGVLLSKVLGIVLFCTPEASCSQCGHL